jgi:predicted hydrolase (HD superfamily)
MIFRILRNILDKSKQYMTEHYLNLGRTQFGDDANAGKLMSMEKANILLKEWVPNEKLQLHMKQVAALMKAWAIEKESADEPTSHAWELSGLLHDADWEKYPDTHCKMIIEELERRNIDPAVIHCIASHGPKYFGVEPESKMDKMIYVFDELSGFIHAASLIRPTGYEGMDTKSVLKKLKTLSFAAQVNREDISDAIGRIDQSLEEIIQFILDHQKNVH